MWLEPVNSYFRLLVHRIARYYGLSHQVHYSRRGLIHLTKTPETIIPLVKLCEMVEKTEEPAGDWEKINNEAVIISSNGNSRSASPLLCLSKMPQEERLKLLAQTQAPKHVLIVEGLPKGEEGRKALWDSFRVQGASFRSYPGANRGVLICKNAKQAQILKTLLAKNEAPFKGIKAVEWNARFYQEK